MTIGSGLRWLLLANSPEVGPLLWPFCRATLLTFPIGWHRFVNFAEFSNSILNYKILLSLFLLKRRGIWILHFCSEIQQPYEMPKGRARANSQGKMMTKCVCIPEAGTTVAQTHASPPEILVERSWIYFLCVRLFRIFACFCQAETDKWRNMNGHVVRFLLTAIIVCASAKSLDECDPNAAWLNVEYAKIKYIDLHFDKLNSLLYFSALLGAAFIHTAPRNGEYWLRSL